MGEISQANIMILLSALLVGVAFGFILQRGRYCMNSAFRDIIFVNDYTLLRAYLLAILIAIVGSNFFEDLGLMGEYGLRRQAFSPVAAIIGGYIFGLGIVMAGGCGSGILYRIGEGLLGAFVATIGFTASLIATYHGALSPVRKLLQRYWISVGTDKYGDEILNPALWNLTGGDSITWKWIVIGVIALIIIPVIIKGKPFKKSSGKGFPWALTGVLIGIMIVVAWWASVYWGREARGLSFSGPLAEFSLAALIADSKAAPPLMFDFWGIFKGTWSAVYVIGVPIGAYLSARALKESKLKVPPAEELIRVFFGGLIMGFGAATAGG